MTLSEIAQYAGEKVGKTDSETLTSSRKPQAWLTAGYGTLHPGVRP